MKMIIFERELKYQLTEHGWSQISFHWNLSFSQSSCYCSCLYEWWFVSSISFRKFPIDRSNNLHASISIRTFEYGQNDQSSHFWLFKKVSRFFTRKKCRAFGIERFLFPTSDAWDAWVSLCKGESHWSTLNRSEDEYPLEKIQCLGWIDETKCRSLFENSPIPFLSCHLNG